MNIIHERNKIERHIRSLKASEEFKGSVLVAAHENIILAKGYGLASVELGAANQRETVYRIGSVSKPITAAAILTLVRHGRLRTTDCVTTYLPAYPQWSKITIEHLLTHRSGIPNLVMLADFPQFSLQPHTLDELMALFSALPLNFEPGTQFEYTNSGYILLGKVIEAISGMNYAECVQQHVFLPAGMEHTCLDDSRTIIPNCASGYEYDSSGRMIRASYIDMSNVHAAGGFLSTIDDLYRLDHALRHHRLFDHHVSQGMNAQHFHPYGYGWFQTSFPVLFHHGGINGFTSTFIRHLEQDFTVIALSNRVTPNTAALGLQLMEMLIED
ncbi:serine hydrolase domain-containing protein [Paenibacillus chibensis]|uniref:serine hydrolase domain-containing protein n=1 Tax=Paenibacillus chibensis TaxID=59846 RepID=UPI000FD7753B|nr:serine hydrolase domain-containing protein [Paenibacillus chibensis]MEC0370399.1 serine hydrolase [Paenibacillus chibensis]